MSTLAPYAIALQSTDTCDLLVGTRDGEVISDEELRSQSPQLGRALVLLRRMGDIMARTADARSRRGALLTELAECFWNEEMSKSLGVDIADRSQPGGYRPIGMTVGAPEPILDASAIWTLPE